MNEAGAEHIDPALKAAGLGVVLNYFADVGKMVGLSSGDAGIWMCSIGGFPHARRQLLQNLQQFMLTAADARPVDEDFERAARALPKPPRAKSSKKDHKQ